MKIACWRWAILGGALLSATNTAAISAPGSGKVGSPEDHLPANIQRLTWFGERASWSPDGRQIAFMSKSFGDAYVIDLKTRALRLLTPYPNAGYLRVQYLPNGDLVLIGARKFEDVQKTRFHDEELWYLKADGQTPPIPLNQKILEGVAISRKQMKIAWAVDFRTNPESVPRGESVIYTADIVQDGGKPKLVNKREAVRAHLPDCVLEAQDFRNNDRELVYVCYRWTGKALLADAMGVDLATGKTTVFRRLPDEYNEIEGIYPNERYSLVESSRGQPTNTANTIDIWRLRLEPNSADFVRMTHWGDYAGYKASNPVVSPDGRTIAFQSSRSNEEAGVGHGLFLLKLNDASEPRRHTRP